MPLEVRHMRHVIALDEHGSFARAATALGLSQSALSRSIQSVEREIGSSLFVRTASGVEPTDGGHIFIARIRQIAQLTDDLADIVARWDDLAAQVEPLEVPLEKSDVSITATALVWIPTAATD